MKFDSKHSYKINRHYKGAGLFTNLASAAAAYTGYKTASKAFNWIGNSVKNTTNTIKNSNIYNKVANYVNPNRNFKTPEKINLPFGQKRPTMSEIKNGVENKYNTLQIQGREAPLVNSDPFRKYIVDPTQETGYRTVNTPLREQIMKNKTNEQKDTQNLMNRVNFETKYEKSIKNPETNKYETKTIKEPQDKLLNPFIRVNNKGKNPAQLILDRLNQKSSIKGKGIKRKNEHLENQEELKKQKNEHTERIDTE